MGNVQMCTSSIPFFKEIILMAFVCDHCGYRNSEIKDGAGIGDKAKKITLHVTNPEKDLNRDVFKSSTSSFSIPEIGLDMQAGSLGSLYTTVEGLLLKVIENLEQNNPFGKGDSKTDENFVVFIQKVKDLREGKSNFTLIIDDPADNCFIYNPFAPEDDPQIQIVAYERTQEQNDDLGLTGMNVDNYAEAEEKDEGRQEEGEQKPAEEAEGEEKPAEGEVN